jgi:aminomethyltransferase
VPVGTPFHARTLALCESLSYRDWAGYYAASSYEPHHEHEYHAIRHAAALIDVSPLFKYSVTGPDAVRLLDRVVTRRVSALEVGRVLYTPWCDERGHVIDDGTVARLDDQRFRMTSADPSLRWLHINAAGLDVTIEDVSDTVAALALQGPLAARVLQASADVDVASLRYFDVAAGRIAGVAVEVSRTGYTGDLGYEIWMPAGSALAVWDRLIRSGGDCDVRPAGMLALDVARVEAGLLLIDVDFVGSPRARTPAQRYTPFELGLGRLVDVEKGPFVGRAALEAERRRGVRRRIVGLEIDWPDVEAVHARVGLPPLVPSAASRAPVPVRRFGRQVGHATTTAWSPALKRLLALATIDAPHHAEGTRLRFEMTVEGRRRFVGARVAATPFFNPPRKTATPPPG